MMTRFASLPASLPASLLSLSTLVALGGTAAAQPSLTPAAAPRAEAAPAARYSETTALALSVGGTVASYALALATPELAKSDGGRAALGVTAGLGILLGPSLGHWYTGKIFTPGLAMRGGALLGFALGAGVSLAECPLFGDADCDSSLGTALAVASLGVFTMGTIHDIYRAPIRARAANRALSSITVAPLVSSKSAGVTIGGRF